MTRKAVLQDVQTSVLVRSRRRCCICFGLNRDLGIKQGQIAHLDQDNTNRDEDNLAFLCLSHHDQYDTKTSQSKNLTEAEVKVLRAELHEAVGKVLAVSVHFGELTLPQQDPYAGQYVRINGPSAEIVITPLPDAMDGTPRYAITGSAYWGENREFGPNMGALYFIGHLFEGALEEKLLEISEGQYHVVKINFKEDGILTVEETNWRSGWYGMNVNFIGEYRKSAT